MKKLAIFIAFVLLVSTCVQAAALRDVVQKATITDAMKARILNYAKYQAQVAEQSRRAIASQPAVPAKLNNTGRQSYIGLAGPSTRNTVDVKTTVGSITGKLNSFQSRNVRLRAYGASRAPTK